jgi:A/G-specific adenine glycosylase
MNASEQTFADHFAERLLAWFDEHGRHTLPWQRDATPYHVWLSEIMLQQTQVATVIPYYRTLLSRLFPACSHWPMQLIDDVLHHWSGLGYYARARNLHKAAQIVVADYSGEFPDDLERCRPCPA